MRPDMQLDYAVFQLTPNRTRCELHIAAQGVTYKLASGLLKPFIAHLNAAEEQLAGGGYTIRLEPPDPGSATWFTKGTMERFVRFVSTPEVLERVGAVEMELIEIEETIRAPMSDASEESRIAGDRLPKSAHSTTSAGGLVTSEKSAKESLDGVEVGMEEIRKQQLSRFLDARRIMLQKEQGMALARAIAAGFNMEQMGDLMLFADNFGAMRLREACTHFMASCKKRQESGLWQEDLKLAAAETAQAEMVFNDSMANYTSSREHFDLQGRGMKHDEFRRASLPGDARVLMGDSGLEKLTRRGSLDELTGEFWQVAARMRAAGMMDGIGADWSSNWQMPKSGRNQSTNEEMHAGAGYVGSNSEIRDTESGPGPVRGHPIVPAWQGHPQNHFMHNIHPLPLHGPSHPPIPPPLGMSRPSQPGLPYPAYHVNPYMAQAYAEANGWQMTPPVCPPYWPGHLGYNGPAAPNANEHGDVVLQNPQNQGVESIPLNTNEGNGHGPASAQRPASNLLGRKDTQETVSTASMQRPCSDLLVSKDTQETVSTPILTPANDLLVSQNIQVTDGIERQSPAVSANQEDRSRNELPHDVSGEPPAEMMRRRSVLHQETVSTASMQRPSSDLLVHKDTQETVSTPMLTPASDLLVSQNIQVTDGIERQVPAVSANQEDRSRNELPHDVSVEPPAEMTRRLPIRSSSPSRRSASPLRKVQIGRSGPKRSGMVNIRNINNYITQSMQDQTERENNDRESSGSWSEDNEESKSDEEVKPEPVRARVQDVIGLFESKKDSNESDLKLLTKENRRLSSRNSVLSRWTDSAALKRDANEPEESVPGDRSRRGVSDAFDKSAVGMESKKPNVLQKKEERERKEEEDILQERDRQGASSPKDVHPSVVLAEQGQDENRKHVTTDDSIIVPEWRTSSRAAESRMINADVELSGLVGSRSNQAASDDSFIVFERPFVGKEAANTWKMSLNLESEMPKFDDGNCNSAQIEGILEPDNAVMVPDQSKVAGSRSADMPTKSDMQVSSADMMDDNHVDQEHADEEFSSRRDVHEHKDGEIGEKSKTTNSKKVSERDAKARAMQEMLERRKAASGSRSGKPNPLAEAQLRAENLRAYKAGLQKSKQEKEKEEKRRIEDLKNQRKERIAARSSPVEGAASQSPSSKQAAQTPPLRVNRSSQTVISQKLSGSSRSPRSSINATASAMSPNMPKIKAASVNKLPRTSSGTPKANENALSCSAPSLSELKKESPKATLVVRSSTGSQRLSQMKKSLKDADPNSPPNANGHTEEKKRSSPLATVRKGIPPAKDIKGESLSVVKPTKGSNTVTKQQKKRTISPKGLKNSRPKERALETEEVSASVEQIDAANAAAVEALTLVHESEAGIDSQETSTDILENNVKNECSSLQDDNMREHERGYAQIRAPASTELEEVLGIADDSIHLLDESKLELAPSDETLNLAEESKEEATNVASPSNADPLACSEGEHVEAEDDINVGEAYHAPIAHMSPREDYSATCKEMDVNKDALNIPIALAEEYNPPRALSSISPLHTPSKNLPRLHEAIQQAHSPEFNGGSRKKGGDSGSQKPPNKDHHAKGLKRLLLLGRKSHRSSTQNMTDWVSVSMTSEVDDDSEDVPSSSVKSAGIGPTTTNADNRADKLKSESNSGSSTGKGSRSFFSLSNFRGKSEGKS